MPARLHSLAAAGAVLTVPPAPGVTPADVWYAWSTDPVLLAGLAVVAWLYGRGVRRLWRRAGVGRGVTRPQVAAFGSGLGALYIALVSPLDALGDALFSAHMVQHLLLMLAAAPLLVYGAPLFVVLWALPRRGRTAAGQVWRRAAGLQTAWDALTHPLAAWLLYGLTLWLWHLPALYTWALRNTFVHEVEHFAFLFASTLFWWVLFSPLGRRRLSRGAGVLYLFGTCLHGNVLGLLITLSPTPWYAAYARTTPLWGLAPLEDQQLAGLLMWMPVGLVYAVLAALVFARWMQEMDAARPRSGAVRLSSYPPRGGAR